MRVMEVNRKGWTAQCMGITGRSLQGDGKEGEVVEHTTLQPPQRALTSWWPRFFLYNPWGISDFLLKYNYLWFRVKHNGRTLFYHHGKTVRFIFPATFLQ